MKADSPAIVLDAKIPALFSTEKSYGIFLMLVSTLFFSFMGALGKKAAHRIPVMEIVFFRAFIATIILVPRLSWRGTSFLGVNRPGLALRGIAGFIAVATSFFVVSRIDLATASVLNQSAPIFVAVLSIFFLKEFPSARLIFHITLAFLGVLLIVKPGAALFNPAALAGVVSGLSAAVAYVTVKKLHATDENDTIVFYFSWISSALSLAFARHFVVPTADEFVSLILLGSFGTIAQLAMTASYKYAPAMVVSPFSFATALFAALWGFLFWHEVPDAWSLSGGALVIACGIGIIRHKKSRRMPMEFLGLR